MTAFYKFVNDLGPKGLEAYAKRVGTSPGYINIHLKHARKVPRSGLMERLWKESRGRLSREDVLNHFFPKSPKKAA